MEDRPGKIFVGGLDFDIDEEEFEKIFAKYGKITEVLLKRDPLNRKSRGFGFITYENPSDAEDAVKHLDKQDIKGKVIHVDHAVRPAGQSGDRGGRGGGRFRGSSNGFRGGFGGRGSSSFSSRGGGFRGRGGPRSDRGGRGSYMSMGRGGYGDDRRNGFPPRRSSMDRSYSDRERGPPMRRDDDRDKYGSALERDRYGGPPVSERRARDPYASSPTRGLERDYPSSRDMVMPSRGSFDAGRDSFISRDPYTKRDEYPTRESRNYVSSRESPREYIVPRDSSRVREYERAPAGRESFEAYRDRAPSRPYGGTPPPPPRGRSPVLARSAYSPPPRRAPVVERERHRSREYSPGSRRPASYDSHGGPPMKRSRPDDVGLPRGMPSRDMPPRGMLHDGPPPRDSFRGPPRDAAPMRGPARGPPRDGGREGPPFRH